MVDPLVFVLRFLFDFWWILMPTMLFQIVWEKFKDGQKADYRKKMQWGFMEIKFPDGITRNPRAMEEVFNSLHSIAPDTTTDLTWINLNIKGFAPRSYAFFIIANDHKIRFFIRYPLALKEFVKTRFYAQYPEVQFLDSEDPIGFFPFNTPNSLFDCEIFDVRLKKEDSYPIKTYSVLEYLPKEQQIDPITTFSEASWQVSDKEWIIFQIFVLPITPDNEEHGKKWVERGQKLVNKLIGKKEAKETSAWEEVWEFTVNLLLALFRDPVWKSKSQGESSKEEFNYMRLTPGERKVLEAIQNKIGKLGFLCNFRITYIAKTDVFKEKVSATASLISSTLRNFSTEDLNGFLLLPLTMPLFKASDLRIFNMKRKEFAFFKIYRLPVLPLVYVPWLKSTGGDKPFVLNSEELATLFHPPMGFVPTSGIERLPVRETPPSSNIPLVEL